VLSTSALPVHVAQFEQVLHRVVDLVLYDEPDTDDVLVTGEHQRFLGDRFILGRRARTDGAEADLGAENLGHLRRVYPLKGRGQVVVGAGSGGAHHLAETAHHTLLIGTDDVDPGGQPEHQDDTQHTENHRPDLA